MFIQVLGRALASGKFPDVNSLVSGALKSVRNNFIAIISFGMLIKILKKTKKLKSYLVFLLLKYFLKFRNIARCPLE